ncbi:MAG: SPOR domain-containing protein [Sphingomicrobium sp.]
MRVFRKSWITGALCVAAALGPTATPAAATGSYSAFDETATAALARYVRTLAGDATNFEALIGAGQAALELGDAQAAAGFFARADEVNPRSPLPQIGMGGVSVANGDARSALPYFQRAQRLGASVPAFACARGLAYDLLGMQAQAQSDYRVALGGRDRDEASRRLALSLAISGNRPAALQALSPLMARRDPGAARTRAFVLALTGDASGALAGINAVMPGSSSRLYPFLQRLPGLASGQRAAAVNLGIFPDNAGAAYASAAPPRAVAASAMVADNNSNRLAGIDQLLRSDSGQSVAPSSYQAWTGPQAPAPTTVAYAAPVRQALKQVLTAQAPQRIWLQLASGADRDALPRQFDRLKRGHSDLFDGIPAFLATGNDRARLVIGPFKDSRDAQTFAQDLSAVNIAAFQWRNSATDRIVPIAAE